MREEPICRTPDDVEPVECPCGVSRRIITRADDAAIGFHVTEIECAEPHFHRETTEVYYVLDGSGTLVVSGSAMDLTPGAVAYIPPGCVHRAEGDLRVAIATLPPFDPADELTVEDELPRPRCAPLLRHVDDVKAERSTCGISRRVLTRDDGVALGLHEVAITAAEYHYHVRTTEIYHILDGGGALSVGRETYALEPGATIYVPAGLEHGGEGDFRAIVICAPPFDPDDQIVV